MKSFGWKPLLVVAVMAVFLAVPSASALIIEPSWVEFNGEYGTWENMEILVTNDKNETVNVTIEPSSAIDDCYLSYSKLTLAPYGEKNVTLGVLMNDAHGYITYTWGGEQFNQFVLLAPVSGNVTVDMLNTNPDAGDNIGFMLTPWVSGVGNVYVPESGNVYDFTITWGMAYVQLSHEDVGDAVAVFSGENFHARRTFTIGGKTPVEDELEITVPSVDFDDTVNIALMLGDEPIPDNDIDITEPDGDSYTKTTNDDGEISVHFDKEGTWDFYAEYGGKNASKSVTVEDDSNHNGGTTVQLSISAPSRVTVSSRQWITVYADSVPVPSLPVSVQIPSGGIFPYSTNTMGQIQFSFDDVGTYKFSTAYGGSTAQKDIVSEKTDMSITVPSEASVNQYATVSVDAGSTVKIAGGNSGITDTSPSGEYTFKPDKRGRYTVTAETDTTKGTAQFDVYETPVISVYDIDHNRIDNPLKGHQYSLVVTDSDGNIIEVDMKVEEPSGFKQDIVGSEWMPVSSGYYTLSTESDGYFSSASLSLLVEDKYGGGISIVMVSGIIVLLVILFVGVKKRDAIRDKWNTYRGKQEGNKDDEDTGV